MGCGHGIIAKTLRPNFAEVLGVDPSAGMVKQASDSVNDTKITFRQGNAEDLSFLPDKSVDMVVAGQAAHWFDYAKVWPELSRVVKPGGSLALWGYKDNLLIGHPRANRIFDKFCYADGEVEPGVEGMSHYWEPGRKIVRNLLRQVTVPAGEWECEQRILCDIDPSMTEIPGEDKAWLRMKTTLAGFEGYVRTFSALQGWKDAHPEIKSRAEGGQGDLADILMDRMVESEPQWKALGDGWRDAEVEAVWGTYIILAKRTTYTVVE